LGGAEVVFDEAAFEKCFEQLAPKDCDDTSMDQHYIKECDDQNCEEAPVKWLDFIDCRRTLRGAKVQEMCEGYCGPFNYVCHDKNLDGEFCISDAMCLGVCDTSVMGCINTPPPNVPVCHNAQDFFINNMGFDYYL